MADSDDDAPQLSSHALAALQEFYAAQQAAQNVMAAGVENAEESAMVEEDWQLSQFWYSNETADMLAKEALDVAGNNGRIACVSCPTLYHKLRQMLPDSCSAVILEYDKRFARFGKDFVYYDYNSPLVLDRSLQEAFDVVVADPPFLSEECLSKTAQTVKFLAKRHIVLCTGATMEQLAKEILGVHICKFQPHHARNLANEFKCYANYETKYL